MGGGGGADKNWKETMRHNLGIFFRLNGSSRH